MHVETSFRGTSSAIFFIVGLQENRNHQLSPSSSYAQEHLNFGDFQTQKCHRFLRHYLILPLLGGLAQLSKAVSPIPAPFGIDLGLLSDRPPNMDASWGRSCTLSSKPWGSSNSPADSRRLEQAHRDPLGSGESSVFLDN